MNLLYVKPGDIYCIKLPHFLRGFTDLGLLSSGAFLVFGEDSPLCCLITSQNNLSM